ncbi:MAG: hypothetical protein JO021_20575, partial [Alphaproteobacteria bacterium]|nr:hypothetical protein [Alphaproteobacteria bacterium]
MADPASTPFRPTLDQQTTRAAALLHAAKAADPAALARLGAPSPQGVTLADAERAVAREQRFASWSALKAHIAAMDRERAAIARQAPALDADRATLHLRCGSDIESALREAGFAGDFLEHGIPYCLGPVVAGPDRLERMARFLVDAFPDAQGGLIYDRVLANLERGEVRLHDSDDYARVVLWMEHDSWDQLVLVRLLGHYANAKRPRVLELIVAE